MGTFSRGRVRELMRICYSFCSVLMEGLEMRESAAGDATCSRSSWEARSAGGAPAWERISLMLARPPGRLARQARIRNLITAIVIDLGEIRDIHYGNLRILTQSRMQEEGRRKTMSTRGRLPRKWRDRRMSGGNGLSAKKHAWRISSERGRRRG